MAIELFDLAGADDRIRFSPYCWRARMALAHKGLEPDTIPVRFGEKSKIEFSGQKLVPVLRDGKTVIADSWNIAVYLDSAYPDRPPLMDGPHAMALSRFIHFWVQVRIGPPILRAVLMDIHDICAEGDKAYFRSSREARFSCRLEDFVLPESEARALLKSELAPVREMLVAQPFLCGDSPAYADYILFGGFMWARSVSAKRLLEEDDAVHSWRERMLDSYEGLARKAPGAGA
jgi:glutathione S-transferase